MEKIYVVIESVYQNNGLEYEVPLKAYIELNKAEAFIERMNKANEIIDRMQDSVDFDDTVTDYTIKALSLF